MAYALWQNLSVKNSHMRPNLAIRLALAALALCIITMIALISTQSPYLSLANALIVCDGNSITRGVAGNTGGKSYPTLLSEAAPFATNGATVINSGTDNQQTPAMDSTAATEIDPVFTDTRPCVLIANEVRNHVVIGGADVTTAYNAYVAYCQNRRAAG